MRVLIRIDRADRVICDGRCGEDWTTRKESGGILFGSKAMCPNCAPQIEKDAARFGELDYIKGRCPEGMSFADWVRDCLR